MSIHLKPLHEQVIVITGASSGNGLAVARAAARKHARLVLAARNEGALRDIAHDIEAQGGEALYVVADVGDRNRVQAIADQAIERFGGFDTWINDAGASIFGRLEEVSEEDSRRLFDTNFWGLVNGSLIAARHLRQRGGAIINLGSVASDLALPLQGMYSASKHAIKAFTDALRLELEEQRAPVSVTLIKPDAVATPFAQHAKNYLEHVPTLPPPIYKPDDVAQAILHAATHPVRDIYVGGGAKVMSSFNKNFPSAMDWISRKTMFDLQQTGKRAVHGRDSLHQPGDDGAIEAEYANRHPRRSRYTPMSLHPWLTAGVLAAVAGVVMAGAWTGSHRQHRPHSR